MKQTYVRLNAVLAMVLDIVRICIANVLFNQLQDVGVRVSQYTVGVVCDVSHMCVVYVPVNISQRDKARQSNYA